MHQTHTRARAHTHGASFRGVRVIGDRQNLTTEFTIPKIGLILPSFISAAVSNATLTLTIVV